MWSHDDTARALRRATLAVTLALGLGGCFQPLYGERSVVGGPGLRDVLSAVEIVPVKVSNPNFDARLGVELRDKLLFEITGGTGASAPSHRLAINLSSTRLSVVVDVTTARPELENYGLNATYTLTEIASGKVVLKDATFSRVSYDIPGQQQRFAKQRALRDAENRAVGVIAEMIRSRLASHFAAGT